MYLDCAVALFRLQVVTATANTRSSALRGEHDMHLRRIFRRSRVSEPALQGRRASTFELSGQHGAVAVLRRFGARAIVGVLLATGLLALGSLTQNAAAEPMCDVPDPPPICDGGPDPDPEPEPEPEPASSPVLAVDMARQTTDRTAIRVSGWT